MFKKVLKNWKFSFLIFLVFVVLNIILLCQPVVGTYRGITEPQGSSYYSDSYYTKIKFNNSGFVSIEHYKDEETSSIYAGIYQSIDSDDGNYIRIFAFDCTYFNSNSSYAVTPARQSYTRNSVFSISSNDNTYTSGLAVFLQMLFITIEFIFLIRFIFQAKQAKIESKMSY